MAHDVRTYRLGRSRRAFNTVMTALLRRGLGPRSNYLLTTTGRRSGLPRTTPVTLLERDGTRWLVSPYGQVGWVHNVRATPAVRLQHGRRSQTCRAHEVQDPLVAGAVLQQYLGRARITAPFFAARADSDLAAFAAEAERHPVFELS